MSIGQLGWGTDGRHVYRTDDGGRSWVTFAGKAAGLLRVPYLVYRGDRDAAWAPVLMQVTALSFPTAEAGWLLGPKAGVTNADVVLVTADGGRSWHEQLTRSVEPPAS